MIYNPGISILRHTKGRAEQGSIDSQWREYRCTGWRRSWCRGSSSGWRPLPPPRKGWPKTRWSWRTVPTPVNRQHVRWHMIAWEENAIFWHWIIARHIISMQCYVQKVDSAVMVVKCSIPRSNFNWSWTPRTMVQKLKYIIMRISSIPLLSQT